MGNVKNYPNEILTDEDLNAWHKFGLRNFYGPWSVIVRKPNGDIDNYADYGAKIPTGFYPISNVANDDARRSEREINTEDQGNLSTVISDFIAKADDNKDSVKSSEKTTDTLELIGIIGVIENDDVSSGENSTTYDSTQNIGYDDSIQTSVEDKSQNVSR